MKIPKVVPLILSLLVVTSCSSSLSVAEGNSMQPVYEQGDPVLVSRKKHEVMVRLISPRFSSSIHDLPSLLVVFTNRGGSTLDFSTANVTAKSGDKIVRVYTYDKLCRIIKTQAALQAMSAAVNGASQSMAASMPQQSYQTGSVSAYGSNGGYARGYYSGTTTTYNPAATSLATSQINANTSNQMRGIANNRNAALGATTTMLQRNTVFPGRSAGGVVKLYSQDLHQGQPLKLTVSVGGEQHDFYFSVGK